MKWRICVLMVILAAFYAEAADDSPLAHEVPATPVIVLPSRPAVPVLRQDLQEILSRPEYQPRGNDWLWDLKMRLLSAAIRWWEEHGAPLFSDLMTTQPVVYWTIFTVLLLLLLGLLYHIYISLRSAFGTNAQRRSEARDFALPQRLGGPEELLREADAAAEKGQFAIAFRWLYLALIRQLDRRSILHFDGAATNYDYLRQVSAHPEITRHLEPLTRAAEPVWYGYRSATATDYQHCRKWALAAWQEGGKDATL